MAKNLEYKSIELKQETTSRLPDGRLKVIAYAAVFGNVDSYNDIIVKGAFKSSLKKEGHRVAVCYQHDMSDPIAKLESIKEDGTNVHGLCKMEHLHLMLNLLIGDILI